MGVAFTQTILTKNKLENIVQQSKSPKEVLLTREETELRKCTFKPKVFTSRAFSVDPKLLNHFQKSESTTEKDREYIYGNCTKLQSSMNNLNLSCLNRSLREPLSSFQSKKPFSPLLEK